MNKTGLLLPPVVLLLGFAIGHSLPPAAVSGKSTPIVPTIPAAPATPAPAARLTQPVLADWQTSCKPWKTPPWPISVPSLHPWASAA